ncbi:RCC1 domain-containing protein 1, partial [Dinochytrium kinnereticum]
MPVQVDMGALHILLRMSDGSVLSWGNGLQGQLGHGVMESAPTLMDASMSSARVVEVLEGLDVNLIACGAQHSAFATDDGAFVYTCGSDAFGQLGKLDNETSDEKDAGKKRNQAKPMPISIINASKEDFEHDSKEEPTVGLMSCGDRHTVVSDGRGVYGWGDSKWGAVDHRGSQQSSETKSSTLMALPASLGGEQRVLARPAAPGAAATRPQTGIRAAAAMAAGPPVKAEEQFTEFPLYASGPGMQCHVMRVNAPKFSFSNLVPPLKMVRKIPEPTTQIGEANGEGEVDANGVAKKKPTLFKKKVRPMFFGVGEDGEESLHRFRKKDPDRFPWAMTDFKEEELEGHLEGSQRANYVLFIVRA